VKVVGKALTIIVEGQVWHPRVGGSKGISTGGSPSGALSGDVGANENATPKGEHTPLERYSREYLGDAQADSGAFAL